MLRVNSKVTYGYWALIDLAEHYSRKKPVSIKEIAGRRGLPEKYLLHVMLKLKTAGLVESRRGNVGGYLLAHPPEEVTLYDIIKALDGERELYRIPENVQSGTSRDSAVEVSSGQSLQLIKDEIDASIRQSLREWTLKRACEVEERLRGAQSAEQGFYQI